VSGFSDVWARIGHDPELGLERRAVHTTAPASARRRRQTVALRLLEAGREQDVVHRDYADSLLPRQIAEPDPLGAGGDD
jgi:hypothetical protein